MYANKSSSNDKVQPVEAISSISGAYAEAALAKQPAWSRLTLQTSLKINAPGDKYEQEADRVAKQVVSSTSQQDPPRGKQLSLSPLPSPHLQREEKEEGKERSY